MNDDERDSRINMLIDLVADTNRRLADYAAHTDHAIAETNRNVALLSADIASLTRVVRLHLIHDHGYEEPDEQ